MQILGKFCADVRVQNVAWPRDRRSDFRKLVSKDAQDLNEKSHEKACRDLRRSRGSRGFRAGGGQIDPPPVKIGLTYMLFAFDKMLVFYARSYSIMYCLYAYNSGYVIISGDLGMWQHKGSLFGYGFAALSLFP